MSERDFKGVWIPKEIWLSKELSMVEKGILTEISSLDNENHCYASNEYFAEFCQVSVPTISRSIKHLKELGLIETEMRKSDKGSYRVIKMIIGGSNQNDERGLIKMISNYNNTNNIDISNTKVLEEQSSTETKTKKPKKSRYEQCYSHIESFTDNQQLRDILDLYLRMRLEIKDKPMYANQWKGLLNKLKGLSSDIDTQIAIVQYSLDRGYASFYEIKSNNRDVFSEYGVVKTKKMTQEDIQKRENFIIDLENQGKQVKF